jgi:hypothetical protein
MYFNQIISEMTITILVCSFELTVPQLANETAHTRPLWSLKGRHRGHKNQPLDLMKCRLIQCILPQPIH